MKKSIFTKKLTTCCKKLLLSAALMAGATAYAQTISTFAGNGGMGYSGDGGPATDASMFFPSGVTIDGAGNIYICDLFNSVVRKVSPAGVITAFAGNGSMGYSGDGAAATDASLTFPDDVAADNAGNIYISDMGNNVIRKVTPAGIISTIAGTGTAGYSGDGTAATAAAINNPYGTTVDAAGNIYIADEGNAVVRMINTAGIISTIVGTGTAGYSGDGGSATAAELNGPESIAFDAAGNMYIADYFNERVRMVTPAGIINTVAGNGTGTYTGDGGPATAATISHPSGVLIDAQGNLLIADAGNNVVRKVTALGTISTISGNGTGGYSGDGGLATAATMSSPVSLVMDPAGTLYIADEANNVIRSITPVCSVVDAGTVSSSLGVSFCDTGSTTFTASGATSGLDITYQWQSSTDGTTWTNQGTDTVYNTGTINTSTFYCFIVTCTASGLADTLSDTVIITTPLTPSVSIAATPGTAITAGTSVTFTATAGNGGTTPSYQWQKNSADISGETNSTYTTATLANNDNITCIMHSSAPCTNPDSAISNTLQVQVSSAVSAVNAGHSSITLSPNPNKGSFRFEGALNAPSVNIEVLNVLGQTVFDETIAVTNNFLSGQVQLHPSSANGLYLLRITSGNTTTNIRFSVER